MNRNFRCTACGKCCVGQLPLTWNDAEANIDLFPIGMVWTPVPASSKDFKLVSQLGATVRLPDRKELGLLIVPTSFIPASQPCPALQDNNLCGIHDTKPARCRTMPFYPYREERFQSEVLSVKSGWECDTSEAAPVVYSDLKINNRADFDAERQQLLQEVPLIRRYAEYMLKYTPTILTQLALASTKTKPSHIVTSLSSFLTATRHPNAQKLAEKQLPILSRAVSQTENKPELSEFHRHYVAWAKEMSFLAKIKPKSVTELS